VSALLHDLAPLEAQVHAALGVPVRLAALRDADPPAAHAAADAPRARDRQRGRAALARLFARLGRDEAADAVRFPHPSLSLSHSGDWAIAAGCVASTGVGVDLEFARPMDARAARFFLVGAELDYVASLPPPQQGAELLRLWTVKEAVFKACADNRGRLLADFRLDEPAARAGTARRVDGSGFTARYGSIDLGEAWLAVALATSGAAA
jgi:4'-phosphopantetheinyl transferase EntD